MRPGLANNSPGEGGYPFNWLFWLTTPSLLPVASFEDTNRLGQDDEVRSAASGLLPQIAFNVRSADIGGALLPPGSPARFPLSITPAIVAVGICTPLYTC